MRRKKTPEIGADGQPICGARTRSGRPCRGKTMSNGRCRMHGGNAPTTHGGPANPNWKGGVSKPRYDGPPIITDAVAESLADPKLLDLDAEIGVVYARMRQELGRLKANVNPEEFATTTDDLIAGMKSGNSEQIRVAINRLAELRNETRDDDRTWNRILRLIERRRRLVESQRKRIQELDLTVSRAEVVRFANALLEAVTRNVTDPTALKLIADEIRAVTGSISGEGSIHQG